MDGRPTCAVNWGFQYDLFEGKLRRRSDAGSHAVQRRSGSAPPGPQAPWIRSDPRHPPHPAGDRRACPPGVHDRSQCHAGRHRRGLPLRHVCGGAIRPRPRRARRDTSVGRSSTGSTRRLWMANCCPSAPACAKPSSAPQMRPLLFALILRMKMNYPRVLSLTGSGSRAYRSSHSCLPFARTSKTWPPGSHSRPPIALALHPILPAPNPSSRRVTSRRSEHVAIVKPLRRCQKEISVGGLKPIALWIWPPRSAAAADRIRDAHDELERLRDHGAADQHSVGRDVGHGSDDPRSGAGRRLRIAELVERRVEREQRSGSAAGAASRVPLLARRFDAARAVCVQRAMCRSIAGSRRPPPDRTGADEQGRKHGRIGRRQDHECRRTCI